MKKLISLALVLTLCLTISAFAMAEAAAPTVEEVTVELDPTYVKVELGEGYAFTYVPADWNIVEAQYAEDGAELLGTFTNADGSAMVMATYVESETGSSYEEIYNQAVTAGMNAGLMNVNGFEYVSIANVADDQVVIMSTMFLDEECTAALTFTFTFPGASMDVMEPICNQIMGGLDFYE